MSSAIPTNFDVRASWLPDYMNYLRRLGAIEFTNFLRLSVADVDL